MNFLKDIALIEVICFERLKYWLLDALFWGLIYFSKDIGSKPMTISIIIEFQVFLNGEN